MFLNAPVDKIQRDPLVSWVELEEVYPVLSQLARKYVPSVATSVPSERLFSKAGQTVSTARNRLSGKFVEKLLFLQSIDEEFWV